MTIILAALTAAVALTQAAPVHFGRGSIGARWSVNGRTLSGFVIEDKVHQRELPIEAPFSLTFADGHEISVADLLLEHPVRETTIAGDPKASRMAERTARRAVAASFIDRAGHVRVAWSLVQAIGASYLREIVTVTALDADAAVVRIDLLSAKIPRSEVVGRVKGSPVVADGDYLQFEHPLSKSSASWIDGEVRLWIDRALPLRRGQSATFSAAVGVTRPGQLRRDFQAYVELERAYPYRPFLHYNSWYDIGYQIPYTQAQALDRIHAFGEELVRKRGVKMDSFLFDDGWDDRSGGWGFGKQFPDGFAPLRDAAAQYGAAPGVWLSPWGGYDKAKQERVRNGAARGDEVVDGGLALSGPRYYEKFHAATLEMVEKYGINQFKFDGTGNADRVVPGSRFNSDFDAAIQIIDDLRSAKPGLFINLTTGTYPSPAWLRYADSIWRGGEDHAYVGEGTPRQRWMTYRDRETYENVVVKGPLFPLNSLMLHGVIFAEHTPALGSDPGGDFADEVHSFFGSGTDLQELYVTPSLLNQRNWDVLADAAKWARANADVLIDTHWIGGDPGRGDVYGWAAWSPRKAIATIRNPGSKPQAFTLDPAKAFELPDHATDNFVISERWGPTDRSHQVISNPITLTLKAFEVRTLEFAPVAQ